jgi:hypothetical protein
MMAVLLGPPCPKAERVVGAITFVPARGMRRKEHVVGGVDRLGRRGLGLGGGRRTAGMAIMWLIESSIGVGGRFWAWASAVDSASCRSSRLSISVLVVLGCTFRGRRNGRGERKSGEGRSGCRSVSLVIRVGWRSSNR